ncbi:uncharacterized protein LOC143191378 isoform X1 [Rhynchophorus ferrugineus]
MLTAQECDIGDFAEMESMQFVNPHDVNPLIGPASTLWATGPSQQVSSKPLNMLHSDDIQLKMEEFGDLSALLSVANPNAKLTAYTDELNTPIFDKDAFDFPEFNDDDKDLKVKVEYNAQLYPFSGALQPAPSNDNANMFLYQSQLLRDSAPVAIPSFMADKGQPNVSLDNINLNSNITYCSSSNLPSPQDDQYSYVSSPADDQQLATSPYSGHCNTKPKLNLNIDQFNCSIKEEGPSALNTPDLIEDVVNMGSEFDLLDLVNGDITVLNVDADFLSVQTNRSEDQYSPSSGTTTSPPPSKRPRKRKAFYDDDDEDYIPPSNNRQSTVNLNDLDGDTADNYSTDDSDYEVKKTPVKRAKLGKPRGRPPKRTDSLSSDGSKDTELSKYRELRDKNNEASRRSRLKRKIKEQEYEKEADELREKNIKLKTQVEELEKLVNTYRKDLFSILGKSKQV